MVLMVRVFEIKLTRYLFTELQPSKLEPVNHQHIAQKKIRIAVYLMSGVLLTMEVERNLSAQHILSIVQTEAELGLSRVPSATNSQPVFAMWMCSSELELQLRPNHRPIELAARWNKLVGKYGSRRGRSEEEPLLYVRRNVFLSKKDEEQIKEPKVVELLYAEARHNVLEGSSLIYY